MDARLRQVFLGVLAAGVLAAPAAHAFTVENKDEGGQYGVPKFNLEEQSKNFRKSDGTDAPGGKHDFSTPLGSGSVQFGAGSGSNFGSLFGPSMTSPGWSAQSSRQEFDRRLAPPNSMEYNGLR